MNETPAERLERELRVLIPVTLTLAQRAGASPSRTSERVVSLVMLCARPLLAQHVQRPDQERVGSGARVVDPGGENNPATDDEP